MKTFQNKAYSNMESNHHANKFRVDAIWDCNAPKYRVGCQTLHVTKATKYIGYTQLFVIAIFSLSLLYAYTTEINYQEKANGEIDWTINVYMARYVSSLLSALTLQLALVMMMVHGVRTSRRSLLIPYISFAAVALFLAIYQLSKDVLTFIDSATYSRASENSASYILIHFTGILVHVWCMKVVCKCYSYFGDKNVAESIGQQLQSTNVAFSVDFSRPPPYSRLATTDAAQPLTQA